jgi:hypothetical protein
VTENVFQPAQDAQRRRPSSYCQQSKGFELMLAPYSQTVSRGLSSAAVSVSSCLCASVYDLSKIVPLSGRQCLPRLLHPEACNGVAPLSNLQNSARTMHFGVEDQRLCTTGLAIRDPRKVPRSVSTADTVLATKLTFYHLRNAGRRVDWPYVYRRCSMLKTKLGGSLL